MPNDDLTQQLLDALLGHLEWECNLDSAPGERSIEAAQRYIKMMQKTVDAVKAAKAAGYKGTK